MYPIRTVTMEKENVLDKAAESVYQLLEIVGGDPTKLPTSLQPIAFLYAVQAKIDNGGFRYLFESDFPFHPPYSLFSDAYRKIGAFDAADRLDRAVRLFPFPSPETQQEARNAFMNSLDESAELFSLGDEVCGDDRVWQLMEQYVKTNASVFAPKP
jgi:hypothetical protein